MSLSKKSRRLVVSLVVGAIALTGALASAAWLTSGSGNGSVKAGTASSLTVESVVVTGSLVPGGSGDVKVKVSNPNAFKVAVTSIAANGDITSDTSGCDKTTSKVTFTAPSDVSGLAKIAANGNQTYTLSGAASMGIDSDNACQGATFSIPVTVSAAASA